MVNPTKEKYAQIVCRKAKRFSGNLSVPYCQWVTPAFSESTLHAICSAKKMLLPVPLSFVRFRPSARSPSEALRVPADRLVLVTEVLKQQIGGLVSGSTSQSVDDQLMLPHRRYPALLIELACKVPSAQ
jgi:hypothetical protein